jgi:hypothetical protein
MSSWRHILSMYFSSSSDSLMYRKRSITQATSWRPASSGLTPASASASWSGPGAAKQPGIPTLRYICMKFEALFFLSPSSAYIGQRQRFWAISILFLNSQRWCITFVNSMSGESTRLRLRVNTESIRSETSRQLCQRRMIKILNIPVKLRNFSISW